MKILVIEDEEGLREALIQSLTDEGYLADGAEDGETGFSMIASGLYDLVILDIMLPVIDGFEVLRRTRNRGIAIPIILLTARSALRDKIGGMDLGADDYLIKPFDLDEVLVRIEVVLRRCGVQVVLDKELFDLLMAEDTRMRCRDVLKAAYIGL